MRDMPEERLGTEATVWMDGRRNNRNTDGCVGAEDSFGNQLSHVVHNS